MPILDHLLSNWFCKSLLPPLAKDVCLSSAVTEDQFIRRAQHLHLIYSQSGTLYELLPHAPGNLNPPATQLPRAHVDGLVGTTSNVVVKQLSRQASHPSSAATAPTQSAALPTAEVHSVQSTQKPSGKNKKNKKKIDPFEEKPNTHNNPNHRNAAKNDKGKEKPMIFPCKICAEDHLTYKCPQLQECIYFITQKDSGRTPVVLHNPFPNPH